jgi:hypothetical protein
MQNTYYLASQTVLKYLHSTLHILQKGQAYSVETNTPETDLVEARLAPDMHTFKQQIRIISDNAKGMVARLAGQEIPKMEDTEENFDDLIVRIEKTIKFVESFTEANFAETDEQKIILPYFKDKFMTASDYVKDYALANFFFHVVTAYAILRNTGVHLGKKDFVNGLNLQDL